VFESTIYRIRVEYLTQYTTNALYLHEVIIRYVLIFYKFVYNRNMKNHQKLSNRINL